jgi:hypothetical protein
VVADHVRAGGAENGAQHEPGDDGVVELACDRDEIGDEVERHGE